MLQTHLARRTAPVAAEQAEEVIEDLHAALGIEELLELEAAQNVAQELPAPIDAESDAAPAVPDLDPSRQTEVTEAEAHSELGSSAICNSAWGHKFATYK